MIALKYTRAKLRGWVNSLFNKEICTSWKDTMCMCANVCNQCHIIYTPGNDVVFLCVFLGNHRTLCTLQIWQPMCTNDFRNVQWHFSKIFFHLWYFILQAIIYLTWNTLSLRDTFQFHEFSPVTFQCTISTAWVVSFTQQKLLRKTDQLKESTCKSSSSISNVSCWWLCLFKQATEIKVPNETSLPFQNLSLLLAATHFKSFEDFVVSELRKWNNAMQTQSNRKTKTDQIPS